MWRKWIPTCRVRLSYWPTIVAVLAAVWMTHAQAEPLEQWHWRNPLPQGNALHNVVFVNGTYVAVGELGTILTSSDGTNWVSQESGTIDGLRDCAYGAGQYVVVGDFGTVLTSTNAVSWTSQYAGTFYSLNGVTFADGQFVAVGEQTTILTSLDGAVWTPRSSGNWDLFDVIHAEGIYVAVGGTLASASTPNAAVILTSPDARVWVPRLLTPDSPIVSAAHGAGRFAAAGAAQFFTLGEVWISDDGVDWQPRDVPTVYPLANISYGEGNWVFTTGYIYDTYYSYQGGEGGILASDDLRNWSQVVSNNFAVSGSVFGNGQFIAACRNGAFLNSANGSNWTTRTPSPQALDFHDLKYVNGSFVGVAGNQLAFSADGSLWTNGITLANTSNLLSITYGNGRYVAGGEYHTIWTSANGLDWTNVGPDLNDYPYAGDFLVARGNGLFVALAGAYGVVLTLTSPDGLNWTTQQPITNTNFQGYFRDLTFGDGRFVAVADSAIATSSDGTNWMLSAGTPYLTGVTSGNGRFVAVGYSTIMTSSDGTNWALQTSREFGWLFDVSSGGGFFVAVGAAPVLIGGFPPGARLESPIWVSADAIHWSRRNSKTPRRLLNVAFGNGTFVLGGEAGAILQSDPLVNLTMTMPSTPELLLWGPTNRSYRIEYADSLNPLNQWNALTTFVANESPATFSDTSWTNSVKRFYRATLLP